MTTYVRGHRWRVGVALLGLATGIYLTLTPPPGTTPQPSAAARKTRQALDRKLAELTFTGTSLDSALNAIERGGGRGVTIRYDLDALRDSGIKPAQLTVTASLRDVRAGRALDVVLEAASPQTPLRHFIGDDGTIMVTTPRGDARRAVTRTYRVWDILLPDRWSSYAPQDQHQLTQDVLRLVTETIEPESWVDAGGEIGSVSIDNGVMTVRQTPENLWLLEGLLRQLARDTEAQRLQQRLEAR